MTAGHPTFTSGHCFMTGPLNKQEVEFVGAILHDHLERMRDTAAIDDLDDYRFEVRRVNAVLKKMDYPLFTEATS